MNSISTIPNLIEPGTKLVLKSALKRFHIFRDENQSYYFNIIILIAIIIILYVILSYRYKGNQTKEEIQEKNRLKKEYIINKLMLYSDMKTKKKSEQNLITDLPLWDNHPEKKNLDMKNININYNNG